MMNPKFKAAVIVFVGSNGDRDLFETLEKSGFTPFYHPAHMPLPKDIALAALPGGFSYGDYWRAGMLASQAPAVLDLNALVQRGGLVIGICNGFQILVEAGFLPGALRYNDPPGFLHRWVDVRVAQSSASPWFHDLPPDTRMRMPMAHGEGNYFHPNGGAAVSALVPLVYEQNPNGSMADAAALLDSTGRILGIMPHPERAADADLGSDDGLKIFKAAHAWWKQHGQIPAP